MEFQQALVIILGGVLILGMTILVGVIMLKIRMSKHLKTGLAMALAIGLFSSFTYPIIVWTFQADNDLPKLVTRLPDLLILVLTIMLFGFLGLAWRSWSLNWSGRLLMRLSERRLKAREQKSSATAKK